MQLPLEADGQRVLDELCEIKRVMEKAKGRAFADLEVSGHPEGVRLAPNGTPIFRFGLCFYAYRDDGSVSEVRQAERQLIAYRRYDRRGDTVEFDLTRRDASIDVEEILERAVAARNGEPDLN
jgi:hypothetical protein